MTVDAIFEDVCPVLWGLARPTASILCGKSLGAISVEDRVVVTRLKKIDTIIYNFSLQQSQRDVPQHSRVHGVCAFSAVVLVNVSFLC